MIFDHTAGGLSELDTQIVASIPPGGNWRHLPETIDSARVRQIRQSASEGKGSRSTYYGRMTWDRPAYTISTYFSRPGNGCFIHPSAGRLITVREAARLQSFPDAYRFFGRGRSRFIQVGNAVPPLLGYQLGRVLKQGTMVDLFCGAGGLSLGLEWAGFHAIAAVDNDAAAIRTFIENRGPQTPALVADLSEQSELQACVSEIKLRAAKHGGAIALVAGGPPCQGFSTAGDCRLDDPRNQLVFSFVEAVSELEPMQVLMENVASLTFRGRRSILEELQQAFHEMGYMTSVVIAHAEGYGVPQLRRRLFLQAVKAGLPVWPAPQRRLLAPTMAKHQPQATAGFGCPPFSVRDAISDLPSEAAPSPDRAVSYAHAAQSDYQRWSRGIVGIDTLCPPTSIIEEPMTQPLFGRP